MTLTDLHESHVYVPGTMSVRHREDGQQFTATLSLAHSVIIFTQSTCVCVHKNGICMSSFDKC